MIPGFDPEFRDLPHYILAITERIWEGRRIDDIARYYSDDCVVETPLGTSRGTDAVIEGTRATLVEFPDRQLLGEDVLVSGNAQNGLLSSHRIYSPMTHRGSGRFGAASGRAVRVRTIADCVCRDNRVVHEWLVRDHGAVANQLGLRLSDLAQAWLAQQPQWTPPTATVAPAPYRPELSVHPLAQQAQHHARARWMGDEALALCDRAIESALPGGVQHTGLDGLQDFWQAWRQALTLQELQFEQVAVHERAQRASVVSLRWRARLGHLGDGRFGPATGRTVDVLAIEHQEWHGPRMARQWLLIDEVALWMQLLRT